MRQFSERQYQRHLHAAVLFVKCQRLFLPLLLLLLLLLLLRWHYSPMRTFVCLMDFPQAALFFDPSFQFVILPFFNMSLYTVPPSVSWSSSQSTSLRIIVTNLTYFLLLSILLTQPILSNRIVLTNENITKSPNSSINSLLYHFLQISFTLIPKNVLLKIVLSKLPTSLLAIT
jgi:hypothetical protein